MEENFGITETHRMRGRPRLPRDKKRIVIAHRWPRSQWRAICLQARKKGVTPSRYAVELAWRASLEDRA